MIVVGDNERQVIVVVGLGMVRTVEEVARRLGVEIKEVDGAR